MPNPTIARLLEATRRQPPFFWLVAAAGVVTLFVFVVTGLITYKFIHLDKFGYAVDYRDDHIQVISVNADGPAAGRLRAGDNVLTLLGPAGAVPVNWRLTLNYSLHGAPAGTSYSLRIARQGAELTVPLQLQIHRVPNVRQRLRSFLNTLFSSLPFAIVALLVGALRPRDPTARRAFYAMICFALNYSYSGVFYYVSNLLSGVWLGLWVFHLIISGATLFIALAYILYLHFPAGAPPGRVWTGLKWLLLICWSLLYPLSLWRVLLLATSTPLSAQTLELLRYARLFSEVYIVLGLAATCLVCLHNFRRVTIPDQRNRIRLTVYATLMAFVPNVLLYVGWAIETAVAPNDATLQAFLAICSVVGEFSPLLIAVVWGYAILKQRVFGAEMAIRRGVQYLLARNVLRVILALPVVGLVLDFSADLNRTLKEILFAQPLNLLLLALAALSLKYREQLATWLDRRFFRAAYGPEQLLAGLIERIKEFNSLPEMARLVGERVTEALHPAQLYIYHLESDRPELTLGYSISPTPPPMGLPAGAQLLRMLAVCGPSLEADAPVLKALPASERAWLTAHQPHLLVPMCGLDEKLMGVLLCGEKRSEQPYTAQDRNLLPAVARQMAVVAENIQLKERVNRELKIKHQVLAQLDENRRINLLKECTVCGACYDGTDETCRKDGHQLGFTLPVERIIDGKYRLEQLVGKGGMGAVYAATDLRLQRRVALKVITGNLFGNRVALQRFEREARAAAGLNHPHIVAVYDYGRAGAEGAYLVMEFLAGVSMRTELQRRGAVPLAEAAVWFEQLLDAVRTAHEAGIIHRDLKPENVLFVSNEPRELGRALLKILDFGLAKFRRLDNEASSNLTAPGTIMGTPGYMSPEQLSGGEADERGDIFALGVMLVETITGNRPFTGKNFAELLYNIWARPYFLPGRSAAVEALNAVLQTCLAPEREQRCASVAELQRELPAALRLCPLLTTTVEPRFSPPAATLDHDAETAAEQGVTAQMPGLPTEIEPRFSPQADTLGNEAVTTQGQSIATQIDAAVTEIDHPD